MSIDELRAVTHELGLGRQIPFEDYVAIDRINISSLIHLDKSPKHYVHHRQNPSPDTPALALGRAVHCAVLEPERFHDEYMLYPKRRAGNEWQAFREANRGRTILSQGEWDEATTIAEAVRTHPLAVKHLDVPGEAEITITWVDPETGLNCKGRLDYLTAGALIDLKTARDITPDEFGKASGRLHYLTKMAWYLDGVAVLDGGRRRDVVLLAVEKSAPYDVVPYRIPPDLLSIGRRHYRGLLTKLIECSDADEWPGMASGTLELEVPDWFLPGAASAGLDYEGVEVVK